MKTIHDYCCDLDLEGVKLALQNGADVNELDNLGETPITNAIRFYWAHYLEEVKHYTKEERDELTSKAYSLLEPLMDYLIEHGANLDLYGEGGITPLCAAYYANSVDATRYLLEHGANPNVNCHLEDEEYYPRIVCSSALQLIHEEVDDGESDPEIEKLLLQYGAKLFVDEL